MITLKSNNNTAGRWIIKAILLLVVVGMIGMFAYTGITKENPGLVRIEPDSLCRADKPLKFSSAVLIDGTDPFTATQLARVRARIHEVRDKAPVGGKVILLLVVPATPFEPRQLIARCNPGSGKDANRVRENVGDAEKRWRDSFEAPLEQVINDLRTVPTSKRSPVIESIVGATQRPDFDRTVPNRHLILISDGLQHDMAGYSHYSTTSDMWTAYTRSQHVTEPQADLGNAQVDFEYLWRPSALRFQSAAHRTFWKQWFARTGAASVQFLGVREENDGPTVPATTASTPKTAGQSQVRWNQRSNTSPEISAVAATATNTLTQPVR